MCIYIYIHTLIITVLLYDRLGNRVEALADADEVARLA